MESHMTKKYIVTLTNDERQQLLELITKGRNRAKVFVRARILLDADEGLKDEEIAARHHCGPSTVQRTRQRYVLEGLEGALYDKAKSGAPEKLTGKAKAHLVALACSEPPEGRSIWTLQLLGDQLVALGLTDSIAPNSVRRYLKKTNVSHGSTSSGVLEK